MGYIGYWKTMGKWVKMGWIKKRNWFGNEGDSCVWKKKAGRKKVKQMVKLRQCHGHPGLVIEDKVPSVSRTPATDDWSSSYVSVTIPATGDWWWSYVSVTVIGDWTLMVKLCQCHGYPQLVIDGEVTSASRSPGHPWLMIDGEVTSVSRLPATGDWRRI